MSTTHCLARPHPHPHPHPHHIYSYIHNFPGTTCRAVLPTISPSSIQFLTWSLEMARDVVYTTCSILHIPTRNSIEFQMTCSYAVLSRPDPPPSPSLLPQMLHAVHEYESLYISPPLSPVRPASRFPRLPTPAYSTPHSDLLPPHPDSTLLWIFCLLFRVPCSVHQGIHVHVCAYT